MEPKEPKKKNRNSAINFLINRKLDKQLSKAKKTPQPKPIQSVKVIPNLSLSKEINPATKLSILELDLLSKKYDKYDLPKFSNKQIGPLKSYSYNTYQGLYKDYNEDKVSLLSLLKKPTTSKLKAWTKISSYFEIFAKKSKKIF